jgi:hypothetical protein
LISFDLEVYYEMNIVFPICNSENRVLDGFDLIGVLGLVKEYNWREIWKRYLPQDHRGDTISMYVASDRYFMEMHIQKMQRIILSEKFNTNPFFMQQVIQRIFADHGHELVMEKIRKQGIDTGDNPICLACSMGNTIVDFIANKNEPFPERKNTGIGPSNIEQTEKRKIDIYDLSSTLYLCQQNLSKAIYKRYGMKTENGNYAPEVILETLVGSYKVSLKFQNTGLVKQIVIPEEGNISVSTIHQLLERMNFHHAPELIKSELDQVGLEFPLDKVMTAFTLYRYINNTALSIAFTKQ